MNIQQLQQKITENPNDLKLIEEYAIALSDVGQNEAAYKNFLHLKELMPDNPMVYYNIGIILEKLKEFKMALLSYEKAYDLSSDDVDIMFNLANLYLKNGDYLKAEELYLKIIQIDNQDSNSYFYLGVTYSKLKNHEKSIEYLLKSLTLNSDDIIAKFTLAYEYKEINEIEKAISTYQDVIKLSPDYSWAYYNLAIIYLEIGDEDNAILYLERTININSKDVEAIKLASKIFMKHKKYAIVEKLLKSAVEEMPMLADLSYLLAQLYKEMDNTQKYVKYLKMSNDNISTFSGNVNKLVNELEEAMKDN